MNRSTTPAEEGSIRRTMRIADWVQIAIGILLLLTLCVSILSYRRLVEAGNIQLRAWVITRDIRFRIDRDNKITHLVTRVIIRNDGQTPATNVGTQINLSRPVVTNCINSNSFQGATGIGNSEAIVGPQLDYNITASFEVSDNCWDELKSHQLPIKAIGKISYKDIVTHKLHTTDYCFDVQTDKISGEEIDGTVCNVPGSLD